MMKLELAVRKSLSHVKLEKDEKNCLGIIISDNLKTKLGPIVKKVKNKSQAEKSFAITRGDVILSLNGRSMVGTKTKDVIRMIRESKNTVDFKLQYETKEIRISQPNVFSKKQLKTELLKVDNSFGFILRKKDMHPLYAEYPVISNIKEGSQIQRRGEIYEGDRLVKIDNEDLSCLTLREIACILQEKRKAEFTFEYNVGVVNFIGTGMKVHLEIDVPVEDLGLYLNSESEESTVLYIESIKLGSTAERCGVFSEGDTVLSINEIDAKYLKVPKANILLQSSKKRRSICFLPSKRIAAKILQIQNETCLGDEKELVLEVPRLRGDQACNWKHVNSIADGNKTYTKCQNYVAPSFYRQQISTLNFFQSIVPKIRSLKESLSLMLSANISKNLQVTKEKCTLCCRLQSSVKICILCSKKLNSSCIQSIDLLKSIVINFVAASLKNLATLQMSDNAETSTGETETYRDGLSKSSAFKVINALTETLPKIFSGDTRLLEQFNLLAMKINSLDSSCAICDREVKIVWIIVQNLLLLFSFENIGEECKPIIDHLVNRLLDTKFSCYSETECSSLSESLSTSSFIHYFNECGSSKSHFINSKSISRSESISSKDADKIISTIPKFKVKMKNNYLKITQVQSLTALEGASNQTEFYEGVKHGESLVNTTSEPLKLNMAPSSSVSFNTENTVNCKKIFKDKRLSITLSKVWRSLDSVLNVTKSVKGKMEIKNEFPLFSKKCKRSSLRTKGKTQDASGSSRINLINGNETSRTQQTVENRENASDTTCESNHSSSSNQQQSQSHFAMKKTRTETLDIELVNEGEGFGISVTVKIDSCDSSSVPVISDIKPRSPSQRSGVLKVDDRIIAINNRSIIGLSPKEIHVLKTKSFAADSLTLTVEFEVMEEEIMFGTFDVVLDRTLKIGLIFEDMQRGFPMIIAGIIKGSGAHRCGQLFPGDKIKFFRCIRNEEFDPVSCNYSKEESVLITVQRDPIEDHRQAYSRSSPCYLNPCFSHQDSGLHRGPRFIVKRTDIRPIEGTDNLVLDLEVTLFRDPVYCDFGFLVGENLQTGHAYITGVRPDGPAYDCGVIKKLDRIVEINGVSVDKKVENFVITLLSQASHKVDLLIRRLCREQSGNH